MSPTSAPHAHPGPVPPRPAGAVVLGAALCLASVLMLLVAAGVDVDVDGRVVALAAALAGGITLVLRSVVASSSGGEQSPTEAAPAREGLS